MMRTMTTKSSNPTDTRTKQQKKLDELNERIQKEILQKPILYLAKNRDYDEILFVLSNPHINVREWLDIPSSSVQHSPNTISKTQATTCQSTVISSSNSSSNTSTKSPQPIRRYCAPNTIATTTTTTNGVPPQGNRRRRNSCNGSDGPLDDGTMGPSTNNNSHRIREVSTMPTAVTANADDTTILMDQFRGESIIHLMLKYEPPVEIIDLLFQRMMEYYNAPPRNTTQFRPEVMVDMQGRTPLHVAVSIGAPFDLVQRLVGTTSFGPYSNDSANRQQQGMTSFVSPVFMLDSRKRYPLHWACTNPGKVEVTRTCLSPLAILSSKTGINGSKVVDNYNLFKVIQLLISLFPQAVLQKDNKGYTPLDIARLYNVKDDIVRYIQQTVLSLRENQSIQAYPTSSIHCTTKNTNHCSSNGTLTTRDSSYYDSPVSLSSTSSSKYYQCPVVVTTTTTTSANSNAAVHQRRKSLSSIPETDLYRTSYNNRNPNIPTSINNNATMKKPVLLKTEDGQRLKPPLIPLEILQNIEIVTDGGADEYDDDDVSSVGSGGISTYHQKHPRTLLLQGNGELCQL